MDLDYTTILYLVFGVIYFVFMGRKLKGKGAQKKPQRQKTTTVSKPTSPQPTFEELLEEFTGTKREPEPEPVYEPVMELEPVVSTQERVSMYEARPEVTTKSADPPASFKRFNWYVEKETVRNEYADMLSDLDGAKKALVLTEIFNRKY